MVMELRQLEYLVAVVEEANFTRAAARVHVAQPGVSAQIRRLERELGQPLLDRSARTVRPTEVGAAVLPYARAALAAVTGARQAVDELTGLLRGRVAVGTVTSQNVDLPALLAAFHDDHPGVEITLSEDNSDQLIAALHQGRLDAAIISLGATEPSDLHFHVVTEDTIAAAVSHRHELAARSDIALTALADPPRTPRPAGVHLAQRRTDQPSRPGLHRPRPADRVDRVDRVTALAAEPNDPELQVAARRP